MWEEKDQEYGWGMERQIQETGIMGLTALVGKGQLYIHEENGKKKDSIRINY